MDRKKHIQEFLEGFHAIQHKMIQKHRPLAGIEQVTFSQWRVLDIIDCSGKSSIKEIHDKLKISSSAATQLVNELAKKKYVCRRTDPNDKRVSSVELSPKISVIIKKLKDQKQDGLVKLFQALNDDEFEQYLKLNKKIINSI